MDNKITKNRISDYLSYDWLKMIFIVVAVIVAWEFIYSIASVKLTSGQDFKFYFDQHVTAGGTDKLISDLKRDVFSYDVLNCDTESFNAEQNLLNVRLEVEEGDILFTDSIVRNIASASGDYDSVRAKTVVDGQPIYCFEDLMKDACAYISTFYIDGNEGAYPSKQLIDDAKVEATFRSRMKGDNRFRKESQIQEGIKQEKARIEKLIDDYIFFETFYLTAVEKYSEGVFFTYTKHRQTAELNVGKEYYQTAYEKELEARNGVDMVYGIDMGKLTGGLETSSFVKAKKADGKLGGTADGVIMMVINQKQYQPHLQFETLGFLRYIIETYSDFRV